MTSPTFISSRLIAALAVGIGVWAAPQPRAESLLETMDAEVSSLYQKSRNAIVKVHAQRVAILNGLAVFAERPRIGTGFFIDGRGRLLTAATVVAGTDNCWIDWGSQRVPAKVLGVDSDINLALLQVDPAKCVGPDHETPFLAQGDSDDLKVGSMVIAIGFPRDLPSTPLVGFVGGFDIKCGTHVFPTSYLRAGCKLAPGEGGGPLLNARGEAVGIAIAAHGDDQCYALPINAAKKAVADMLQGGHVQHGWVGLAVSERQILPADRWQVVVQQVYSNSPAAQAGFHEQDVVLRIFTNDIQHVADVLNTMFLRHYGEPVSFSISRNGETQQVTVIIGQRPVEEASAPQLPLPPARPPSLILVPTSVPAR